MATGGPGGPNLGIGKGGGPTIRSFSIPKVGFSFVPFPFNQYSWPLPQVALPLLQVSNLQNLLTTTLFTPPTPPPDVGPYVYRDPLYTNPRAPEYHVSLRSWISVQAPAVLIAPGEIVTDLPIQPLYPITLRSWSWTYNLNLIGQDQLPAGKINTVLPPQIERYHVGLRAWAGAVPGAAPLKLRYVGEVLTDLTVPAYQYPVQLRSWVWSYNLNLIGKDLLPTGEVTTALPGAPIYPLALRSWLGNLPPGTLVPPVTVQYVLRAPTYTLPRAPEYHVQLRSLFGKIPPPVVVITLPFSQEDWPNPRGHIYPIGLRSWTSGPQPVAVTTDFKPATVLDWGTPQGPDRSAQLSTWIATVNLLLAPALPFRQSDWKLTSAAPQPDRFLGAAYNKNLIGQDRLPTGEVTTGLPPQPPLSAIQLRTWINSVNLSLILGPQVHPFVQTDWPLTPAAQRPTNLLTWIDQVKLLLAVPFSQPDWPNPRPQPPAARSWTWSYNLALIGQDQLPKGDIVTDLPPRAPLQPTPIFTATYIKTLIGQDFLPTGTKLTDIPPQPALSAIQLRTWINQTNQALNAFVPPQPFNQFDWPINPGPRQPIQVFTASYNKNLIGKDALPFRQQYWPVPTPFARQPDLSTWIDRVKLLIQIPLYQHDWPLPIRRTPGAALTWIGKLGGVPPPAGPVPFNQYSWSLTPDIRRYIDFARQTQPWLFPPPLPIVPPPTPPTDTRIAYNPGNEWQMLDRIREPGPVGWR